MIHFFLSKLFQIFNKKTPINEETPANKESPKNEGSTVNKDAPTKVHEKTCPSKDVDFHVSKGNNEKKQFSIKKIYGSEGYSKISSWLIKHLLPANSNGIWFGESQSFKTFALVDIGCRVASGLQFSELPTKHGLVIIVAAEGEVGLSKRIRAWELMNNLSVGERLIIIPHAIFPTEEAHKLALIREIANESKRQELPVAMIIFDTMSQCSNGLNEDKAGEVSKYLQSCKAIGEPFGATVINVHHTKKSNANDFRGSSTIVSNVDFMISMKRSSKSSNSTQINLIKMKEGSTEYKWDLQLCSKDIDAVDEEGEPVNTLCVEHADFFALQDEANSLVEKLSQYQVDARWLQEYLEHSSDMPVSLKGVRQAMASNLEVPLDDNLTVRLNRAKSHLEKSKIIKSTKQKREVYIHLAETN